VSDAIEILLELGACDGPGDAIPWVLERAPRAGLGREAQMLWQICDRGDWLIWLVSHEHVSPHLADSARRLRLVACDIAEYAQPLWVARYPADDRPQRAIDMARRYARGECSDADLREAWAAADVAGAAAVRAEEADSAVVMAGWAALAAADAATPSAADAAMAAASWAARAAAAAAEEWAGWAAEAWAAHANIARTHYTWAEVRRAVEAAVWGAGGET